LRARAGRTRLYVDIQKNSRTLSRGVVSTCHKQYVPTKELHVRAPDEATLTSRAMATITAAAPTIYPYDASLDDGYARAKEQLDKAAREDFAALGMIQDAVMVVARGQRRGLR
jgi:hypothetical protein